MSWFFGLFGDPYPDIPSEELASPNWSFRSRNFALYVDFEKATIRIVSKKGSFYDESSLQEKVELKNQPIDQTLSLTHLHITFREFEEEKHKSTPTYSQGTASGFVNGQYVNVNVPVLTGHNSETVHTGEFEQVIYFNPIKRDFFETTSEDFNTHIKTVTVTPSPSVDSRFTKSFYAREVIGTEVTRLQNHWKKVQEFIDLQTRREDEDAAVRRVQELKEYHLEIRNRLLKERPDRQFMPEPIYEIEFQGGWPPIKQKK